MKPKANARGHVQENAPHIAERASGQPAAAVRGGEFAEEPPIHNSKFLTLNELARGGTNRRFKERKPVDPYQSRFPTRVTIIGIKGVTY
jgi:hypothetical protein